MTHRLRKRPKIAHQHSPTKIATTATTVEVEKEKEKEKASNGVAIERRQPLGFGLLDLASSFADISSTLALLYGGCCSNVMAYEKLVLINPTIGSALTFCQMLFITLTSLPSFLYFPEGSLVPSLLPRTVPLKQWIIQVIVLVAGSLLNNWAFAYKVPLPILIVFRSAGLPVSLLFGFVFLKRRYGVIQTLSVAIVSLGVIFAALSGTDVTSSGLQLTRTPEELQLYLTGIAMLTGSLICTATLGLYQEKTYTKYGPVWREGLFYTHLLSLPSFVFLGSDIKQGLLSLSKGNAGWLPYIVLLANLVSQSACVAGVNRLSSQVSQVSTNIALTVRKAISLCLSVWWFGNAWNYQLGSGAAMVFFGSLLYTTCK